MWCFCDLFYLMCSGYILCITFKVLQYISMQDEDVNVIASWISLMDGICLQIHGTNTALLYGVVLLKFYLKSVCLFSSGSTWRRASVFNPHALRVTYKSDRTVFYPHQKSFVLHSLPYLIVPNIQLFKHFSDKKCLMLH